MKALIWKENDEIVMIGKDQEIDNWNHYKKAQMYIVEVVDDLDQQYLEFKDIPEVQSVEATDEHWTDGANTVYGVSDIPTIDDGEGNQISDPSYVKVDAVEGVKYIPAKKVLAKSSTADVELRDVKMKRLHYSKRQALLSDADIAINILEDNGQDSSTMRSYRQALRNVTEIYKKAGGGWKVSVDSINIETFEFPNKP